MHDGDYDNFLSLFVYPIHDNLGPFDQLARTVYETWATHAPQLWRFEQHHLCLDTLDQAGRGPRTIFRDPGVDLIEIATGPRVKSNFHERFDGSA
jgi:hypothetical protein